LKINGKNVIKNTQKESGFLIFKGIAVNEKMKKYYDVP